MLHRQGHGRDGLWVHPAGAEGSVAEVLHNYAVGPAILKDAGLQLGPVQDRFQVAIPPGRPRQRQQVHHADQYFPLPEQFPRHIPIRPL